jgi:AcrR family transcriptional regulator
MTVNRPAANSESTKDRIIDAAEALIAEFGINGVTFREIAQAAGQSNKSGVQYHFGDKENLVNQIFSRRFSVLEKRRSEIFEEIQKAGRLETVRSCLEIFHIPVAELTDKNGRHTHAKFFLQYIVSMQYNNRINHPGLSRDPTITAQKVYKVIQDLLWYIPGPVLRTRLFQVHGMFLVSLLEHDELTANGKTHQSRSEFLDGLLNIMVAAVRAPLPSAH